MPNDKKPTGQSRGAECDAREKAAEELPFGSDMAGEEAFRVALIAAVLALGDKCHPVTKLLDAHALLDSARVFAYPGLYPSVGGLPKADSELAEALQGFSVQAALMGWRWTVRLPFKVWLETVEAPFGDRKKPQTRCGFTTKKGLIKALKETARKYNEEKPAAFLKEVIEREEMSAAEMLRFHAMLRCRKRSPAP